MVGTFYSVQARISSLPAETYRGKSGMEEHSPPHPQESTRGTCPFGVETWDRVGCQRMQEKEKEEKKLGQRNLFGLVAKSGCTEPSKHKILFWDKQGKKKKDFRH